MFLACLAALFVGEQLYYWFDDSNFICGIYGSYNYEESAESKIFISAFYIFCDLPLLCALCAPGNMGPSGRDSETARSGKVCFDVILLLREYVTEIWFDWTYII